MAGMIEEQMGAPAADPAMEEQMLPEAEAGEQQELTPESARAQMQLPEELKEAYERVVQAGLKVMFDPSMRERTLEFMEGPGDPAEKMGEGVAAVMALLFKESNNTMPPQIVIPAGVELLLHAVDVARSGGMELSQDDVAEAMAIMVEAVFRQFGADPQEMQMMNQGGMQ